jgi:hypothetical protein
MTPSLRHLIEDHFKPKWWQFWKKQEYHTCQNYGHMVIYEVPTKCITTGQMHSPKQCAFIEFGKVTPHCGDSCPPISASDPAFFQKLDEYLARGCYIEPKDLVTAVSSMPGPGAFKV